MVLISYIHVLSAAFLMGLAAAAPMGPVNMLAIRRGVIGGWRHTLACGIGSVTCELLLFSLVLFGGHYLFSDLSNPALQTVLAAIGAIVLLPLGIYFLVRAVKEPLRAYASARQHWDEGTVPGHLIAEVVDAAALTIFNPLTIAYWVGVTSNWLPIAHSVLGYSAPGLGILMATAGLATWFRRANRRRPLHPAPHRPELLPLRQRHPRPDPPWLRHFLCDSPVTPSPALKRRVAC
jgi:L-lysine exporter family protein LysE/ArgO